LCARVRVLSFLRLCRKGHSGEVNLKGLGIDGADDETCDRADTEIHDRLDAQFRLRAVPESSRVARELTDVVLMSWALRHLMEPARLIVCELFTNALRATAEDDVFLLLKREVTSISIGVWDSSPAMPVMGACDPDDESGRGLYIVAALADDHGCYRVGRPNGKIVWARLTS
jgi:hypothetical protein